MTATAARYKVQVVEADASVYDCGTESYSQKAAAVRVAKHLAQTCPLGAISFDVFDRCTELCVFSRRMKP